MRFFVVILMVLFSFYACDTNKKEKIDISDIDVNFLVKRFEIDFYTSNSANFTNVKKEYSYFFPEEVTDSISFLKINSTDEQELFLESQQIYKDFSQTKAQLTSLFKHIKYYNPKFSAPTVVTMLTNIDYNSSVIYADSLLLISLDVFLGKNHKFYEDFPKYIKENNTKKHLVVAVANSIIEQQIPNFNERSFVGKMITEGKKMYLLDSYVPSLDAKEKIGYEKEKFAWVLSNEEQIWSYFIQKKLLFSTDTKLNKRFLDTAPFSKFYMEQDNLSPGRIGVWVGWQIVRSYMQHNDVSLQELIKLNNLELFKNSKYKPRK